MSCNRRLIRAGLVLAIASLASGCIDFGGGDVGAIYQAAKTAWHGGEKVTLQEAASVPYASIGVQFGGSQEIMLILASDTAGRQLWTSSARIAITTDHGRIVRTSGFERNLGGYESRILPADAANKTSHWQADFPDLGLYSISIICRERLIGDETIMILGKDIRTHRFEESCEAEQSLDWSFKNTYWRDPASGLAWRSIQHVHPRLGPIETEILRPPA
jgi:hypothetical protein